MDLKLFFLKLLSVAAQHSKDKKNGEWYCWWILCKYKKEQKEDVRNERSGVIIVKQSIWYTHLHY